VHAGAGHSLSLAEKICAGEMDIALVIPALIQVSMPSSISATFFQIELSGTVADPPPFGKVALM